MDMYTCNYRTHGLNETKFIGHFVLNVVYLILIFIAQIEENEVKIMLHSF